MKKQLLFLLMSILISISLFAQESESNAPKGAVEKFPNDLDKEKLLIPIQGKKMWDNALLEPVKENYPFKYEEVPYKDVNKYKEKGYKYMLWYTADTQEYLLNGHSRSTNYFTAYIMDLKTNITYAAPVKSKQFLKKAVRLLIENVRKQYKIK